MAPLLCPCHIQQRHSLIDTASGLVDLGSQLRKVGGRTTASWTPTR